MQIVLFLTIQFSMSTQFNISISTYSVYSNRANSVYYKNRFCLYTVKCQNTSILNNSVSCKYSFNVKKQFHFKQFSFRLSTQLKCKYMFNCQTFLFQAIQFSQTVLIQTIQFSIIMQFSSI